jgi:hypothetical protein
MYIPSLLNTTMACSRTALFYLLKNLSLGIGFDPNSKLQMFVGLVFLWCVGALLDYMIYGDSLTGKVSP